MSQKYLNSKKRPDRFVMKFNLFSGGPGFKEGQFSGLRVPAASVGPACPPPAPRGGPLKFQVDPATSGLRGIDRVLDACLRISIPTSTGSQSEPDTRCTFLTFSLGPLATGRLPYSSRYLLMIASQEASSCEMLLEPLECINIRSSIGARQFPWLTRSNGSCSHSRGCLGCRRQESTIAVPSQKQYQTCILHEGDTRDLFPQIPRRLCFQRPKTALLYG